MDVGYAVATKKLGTIGCTVAIMRAGTKLPSEITIKTREESGLDPLPHDYEITVSESESVEPEEATLTEDEIVESVVDAVVEFEAEMKSEEVIQEEE